MLEDVNVPAGDQLDHWEAEDRKGWAGNPSPLPPPDSPTLSTLWAFNVQNVSESDADTTGDEGLGRVSHIQSP